MADTPEMSAVAALEFNSNPWTAEALQAARETPQPFAQEMKETGIGAILTGLVEVVEVGANRTMAQTQSLAVQAMEGEDGILRQYERYDARPDEYTYSTSALGADNEPIKRHLKGPATVTYAAEYLALLLNGAGETMPPLSSDAVDAAQRLRAEMVNLRPEVRAVIRNKVIAGAAWGLVEEERDQLILTVSDEHRGLYSLADRVQQQYQQTGALHPDHIRELLHHFGLNEHTEAVIGHLSGVVGREAQRLPVIGDFVKRVVGVFGKLRNRKGEIGRYITAEVDNAVHGLARIGSGDKLNIATEQTAIDALEDVAAFVGPEVIPPEVDKAEIARALLAVEVLDDPVAIFNAGSDDVLGRQIAEELKFLALFDLSEVDSDSRIKTAIRLEKEARAAAAASAAGALSVEQEVEQ